MTMDDYNKAYKAGKKDYQARLLRGEQPTLKILDDILRPEDLIQKFRWDWCRFPSNRSWEPRPEEEAALLPAILCRF